MELAGEVEVSEFELPPGLHSTELYAPTVTSLAMSCCPKELHCNIFLKTMCLFFLAIYSELEICECRTREAFMKEKFPQIRHVILDEVQNFKAQDGDWLTKARALVKQHSERESSHDDYSSDNDICQNDGPGYLWCFIDKAQGISRFSETGIPQRLPQTFSLTKVIRNSKRIFERAEEFLDTRTWRYDNLVRSKTQVTIGHDFEGEKSEVEYSEGQRIACLNKVLESLLKEGYSKGDIAVLCLTEPLEGNELKQLQEFTSTVNAERNDDDNIVLSTVEEYGGLERPVVIIVGESFDYNSKDVLSNRVNYCAFTRAMVKLITLKKTSRGQKRKESN